jgi:hypothetical protein
VALEIHQRARPAVVLFLALLHQRAAVLVAQEASVLALALLVVAAAAVRQIAAHKLAARAILHLHLQPKVLLEVKDLLTMRPIAQRAAAAGLVLWALRGQMVNLALVARVQQTASQVLLSLMQAVVAAVLQHNQLVD